MSKNSSLARNIISHLLKYSPISPRDLYLFARKYPPILSIINKIIIMLIPDTFRLPEGIIALNKKDAVISGALLFGVYENIELNLWRSKINKNSIVLDIGGNIGIYSIIASKMASEGRVICFEPEYENLKLLKESIKINDLKNIFLIEKCVGDISGNGVLNISKYNKGKHTLLETDESINKQKTLITTVDEEVKRLELNNVDIVKIDVEGWEGKVLKGMKDTIKKFHPNILFEFAPQRIKESGDDPVNFLREIINEGYTLYNAEKEDLKIFTIEDGEKLSQEKFIDTFINLWAEYNTNLKN